MTTRWSCSSGTATAAFTCGPTPPTGSDGPPRVRLSARLRDGRPCLHAAGWTAAELGRLRAEGAERLLAVLPTELVPAAGRLAGLPAAAGRFELAGDAVWFTPRHPFAPGLRYSLLWLAARAGPGAPVELGSLEPRADDPERVTSVREIYPTCREIPHNSLKLYVHFSGPMSEGRAGRAVRALDQATGEPLEAAFLPMEHELWDPERRRLTVLFDPARIKRGLRPHEELGYPLQPGRSVAIVVDDELRDAAGRRLLAPASRRYRVGPAERRRVDPGLWRWSWPAGPDRPLRVAFDRPLDHALLLRCLRVLDADGGALPVVVDVAAGEGGASLLPAASWRPGGRYRVAIDPRLEDLAGNSLRRVFDRDLQRPEDAPGSREAHIVGFVCDW